MTNKTTSLIDDYHQQCQLGILSKDAQQLLALEHFQLVYTQLRDEHHKRSGLLSILRKRRLVRGLYVWGGVGIGKTLMMDCFFHALPINEKKRLHFHAFMRMVHDELRQHQGQKNPLQLIAKKISNETMVLCFDEFFVTDITDAMILAKLLTALFEYGVCLVATSNTKPDELYKNGLQRPLFVPAIELIKKYTTVLHVPTDIDYRLQHLDHAGIFYIPNDDIADENMEKDFNFLANQHPIYYDAIMLNDRAIQIKKRTDTIIWLDFNEICRIPRSQQDYLKIADQFSTVLISNIPTIGPNAKNTISLFIRLVDIFYDARVRLICSLEKSIDDIYSHGYMSADFIRTRSRLLEMQSEHYVKSTQP